MEDPDPNLDFTDSADPDNEILGLARKGLSRDGTGTRFSRPANLRVSRDGSLRDWVFCGMGRNRENEKKAILVTFSPENIKSSGDDDSSSDNDDPSSGDDDSSSGAKFHFVKTNIQLQELVNTLSFSDSESYIQELLKKMYTIWYEHLQRKHVQQDERTKIEKEMKQNQQTVEPSSSYEKKHRSQITKNQILKTKTSRDYRRQVNERKTTSKTNEL
ncbi:hypothetical protein YC2023_048798 [Brassica napus]